MKRDSLLIAYVALLLCFLGLVIALAESMARAEALEAVAPPINTEGLCVVEMVEPVYELYFTEADVIAMAQMLYGEARGCELLNQQQAVWCVLNRVDDARFPDTIIGVLSQPHQFHGYSAGFPVWDNLYAVALDVLTRWSMEKQGAEVARELPSTYLWFTGYNGSNHFKEAY